MKACARYWRWDRGERPYRRRAVRPVSTAGGYGFADWRRGEWCTPADSKSWRRGEMGPDDGRMSAAY
jgi:hypothetical protein